MLMVFSSTCDKHSLSLLSARRFYASGHMKPVIAGGRTSVAGLQPCFCQTWGDNLQWLTYLMDEYLIPVVGAARSTQPKKNTNNCATGSDSIPVKFIATFFKYLNKKAGMTPCFYFLQSLLFNELQPFPCVRPGKGENIDPVRKFFYINRYGVAAGI